MRRDRRTFNFPLILSFVILLHLLAIGYWVLAHLLPRLEQKKMLAAQQQTVTVPVPEVMPPPPLPKTEADRMEKEINKDEHLPALASREPALNPPSRLVIPEEPFDPDPVLPDSLNRPVPSTPKPRAKPKPEPRSVPKAPEPKPKPKVTPKPEPRPEIARTPSPKPKPKPRLQPTPRPRPEPKVTETRPVQPPKPAPKPRAVPRARLVPDSTPKVAETPKVPRARVVEEIPPERVPPVPEPAPTIVETPVPRARVVKKPAPSIPAPTARRVGPSTPAPSPRAEQSRAVMLAYQQHIVGMMKRNWRQPRGRVIPRPARVRVTILPDGTVSGARLVESSGDRALDASALRAVSLVKRVKPFPEGVRQSSYSPIVNFELQ